MRLAKQPIVEFMESQEIIDADLLKDGLHGGRHIIGVQTDNVEGGLADSMRGTLYNKLSTTPKLFHDKVERTKFFSTSQWLSVSHMAGCWICNSKKIMDRSEKRVGGKIEDIRNISIMGNNNKTGKSFKL